MTATQIKKALKGDRVTYIVDLGEGRGRMVGNDYQAWQPGIETVNVLRKYNIDDTKPGRLAVNGTITREEGDTPNIAQIIEGWSAGGAKVVEHELVAGHRAVVETRAFDCYSLIADDGTRWAVNRERFQVIANECRPDRWEGTKNGLGPLFAIRGEQVVGLIMPYRLS